MISGDRIELVPLDRRHLESLRHWINDPETAQLLGRAFPVSDVEHERWFESHVQKTDRVFFAIQKIDGGDYVGNVWLWDIDWRHRKAEVRVLVGSADSRNAGIGTEALSLITNYAFDHLNLHRVFAYVLSNNHRAKKSFEKAEFIVEGILRSDRWSKGRYIDVYLLGRLKSPNSLEDIAIAQRTVCSSDS